MIATPISKKLYDFMNTVGPYRLTGKEKVKESKAKYKRLRKLDLIDEVTSSSKDK